VTRFKWPIPSDEYLHRDLSGWEVSTVQDRIERYRFIWEEFGPPADMLLTAGFPGSFALHELKRSYLYGNFMATVLLAQIFVEHTLSGAYVLSEKQNAIRKGFAALIDAACDGGVISSELAAAFHRLRSMRNTNTHFTIGDGEGTYMGRFLESKCRDPDEFALKDAEFAIRTVNDFLRYCSPNWNPEKVKWIEEDAQCDQGQG
jgi:hypothetical protein